MSIITRRLRPDDAADWSALLSLAASVGFDRVPQRLRSSWTMSGPLTACYGVHQDDELVASIMFIGQGIRYAGKTGTAYQSCWIMVRPQHQGGPWLGLVYRKAMREFAREGAKFIFGFPNSVASPVFSSNASVNVLPMRRNYFLLRGPAMLLAKQWDAARCEAVQASPGLVHFDQRPICEWKRHEHPGLISLEDGANFVWGRIERRPVAGLGSITLLLAGGCEVGNPSGFMRLAARMRDQHRIDMIRFVSPEGSVVSRAGRFGRSAPRTESFTYIPLVKDLPASIAFDVCTGLKSMF